MLKVAKGEINMKIKRSNTLRYGFNAAETEGTVQSKKVKKYDIEKLIKELTEPLCGETIL